MYSDWLKEYFLSERPKDITAKDGNHKIEAWRAQYKNHMLMTKERKMVTECKAMHATRAHHGAGRDRQVGGNGLDNFVLTRKLNHPELIFNQRPMFDTTNQRFFSMDS